jgi:hypothetical protein
MENKVYKELESEGRKYQVYPFSGRASVNLDRKVTDLLFSLSGKKMNKDQLFFEFTNVFSRMSDDEFNSFVSDTLANTVFVGSDTEASGKLVGDFIWDHFKCRLDSMYDLMYHIWEVNEFTPFSRMATGKETKKTSSSKNSQETKDPTVTT